MFNKEMLIWWVDCGYHIKVPCEPANRPDAANIKAALKTPMRFRERNTAQQIVVPAMRKKALEGKGETLSHSKKGKENMRTSEECFPKSSLWQSQGYRYSYI